MPEPAANPPASATPAAAGLDETGAYRPSAPSEPSELPNVEGYEILEVLGRGGMGVVYKARQVGLKRLVALKMILSGAHAGAGQVARFRAEAEAVARLQHPHIVQVYEIGELRAEGASAPVPYFSLEYIEGGSLAKRLHGTPQPPRAAAQLVHLLADAIHYAHLHGIVHRDLKPANILLADSPAFTPGSTSPPAVNGGLYGEPKIADFGLAKQLDDPSGQTQSGSILGTPSYMAPEQARGRVHEIGPAVDVYALGAILYELLTGRPPFRGETLLDTLEQVRHQEPVPPSRLQPKVPRDLETICLKCLHKSIPGRYASAAALSEDLRRFLAGEPILARPVGASERLWRWCRRNPGIAAALGAVFLSLLIGATVALGLALWAFGERDYAVGQETIAARERDAATTAKTDADRLRSQAEERERAVRRHLHTARMSWAQQALENGQIERVRELLLAGQQSAAGQDDLRGFEWYYLWGLCHRQTFALRGHAGSVSSVAFAPDGTMMATASYDKTIKLWDIPGGRELATLRGHTEAVTCVAFAPDSRSVASVSLDATVRLWDVAGRREQAVLKGHTAAITGATFAPKGTLLATSSQDGTVRLWDLSKLARGGSEPPEALTLKGHRGAVLCLGFSPDGETLATGGADRTVRLWRVADGQELGALPGAVGDVSCLAFSPDGKTLATGQLWDKTIKLWNLAPRSLRRTIEGHRSPGHLHRINCLAFAPDGKTLASGGGDPTVKLWDPATGSFRGETPAHAGVILSLAFSADGRALATAGGDDTVKLWDAATRQAWADPARAVNRAIPGPGGYLWSVKFSPDGKTLAVAAGYGGIPGSAGRVRLWDRATGKVKATLDNPTGGTFRSIAFSPDGRSLAAGSQDGTAKVWDLGTQQLRLTLKGEGMTVSSVAFSPDGKLLAAAGSDGTVKLWDPVSGEERRTLRGHGPGFLFVVFSPDSRMLATASFDKTARLWDAATGAELAVLREHSGWVTSAAFSPDGKTLATTGGVFDHRTRLWDLRNVASGGREPPEVFATLKGHADAVNCVTFSQDGKTLVTGSEDFTVRLWDPVTGLEWLSLREHAGPVLSVAFSRDSKTLAAVGGLVGEVKVWDAAGPEEVR